MADVLQVLMKISNYLKRFLDDFSEKRDYSSAEGRVLSFVLSNLDSDLCQRDIESEFALRPASATEILKRLETNGFIIRIPSSYDARKKIIVPTKMALEYKEEVDDDLKVLESRLVSGIDKKDLEVFFEVAEKMTKNIKEGL